MILTFPRHFQLEKIVVIFFLLSIGFYEHISERILRANQFILFWYAGYLIFALIWSVYGFIRGNPGVKDVFRLEFVWVLFLFIFTILLTIDTGTIKATIYISSFIISVIGLYFILEPTIGKVFLFSWIPFDHVRNINGLIRTNIPNVAFMSFLFPVMIFHKLSDHWKSKIFELAVILVSALFVILSGRRIIQVVLILSLLTLIVSKIRRFRISVIAKVLIGAAVFLLIFNYLNSKYSFVDLNLYYRLYVQKILDNYKSDIRYSQLIEFWKYSKDHLLFGVGFGEGIPSIIRSIEKPWHYELTYSLYLYQTGIIGLIIFFGLFSLLFIQLRKFSNFGKALSMGLLFYLIASGTNPYITSGFDYKFPLLMLMLFIDYELKKSRL